MTNQNPIMAAALKLGKHGFYIFPSPKKNGAAHIKWRLGSSRDLETIKGWWTEWPDALICLDCGKTKIAVVDADSFEGHGVDGFATLDALEFDNGYLPDTLQAETPSKGRHYFFNDPDSQMKSTAGKLGPGVDTRGVGGMVVLAPSVVKDKGAYRWLNKLKRADVPQWVLDKAGAVQDHGPVPDAECEPAYTESEFAERLALIDVEQFSGEHDKWLQFMLACTHSSTVLDGKAAFIDWTTKQGEGEYASEADQIETRWDYNYRNRNKGGKAAKLGTFNFYLEAAGHGDMVRQQPEISAVEDFIDGADDTPEVTASIEVTNPDAAAEKEAETAALNKVAQDRPAEERDRVWTKAEVFEEIVWVCTLKRFFNRADPSLIYDKEGFNDKFGYIGKGKLTKSIFEKSKGATVRKPDRMIYRPKAPEFVNGSWNQWRPSAIIAAEGDTNLWDAHLAYLFPEETERALLIDWLAGILQHQEVKPMHALLLIGRLQGTGKSFVVRVLAALIGERNWQALTQDILANGFTGWATRTKLVTVEELRAVLKSEISKKLHPWITQKTMTVNEKNLPTFTIEQVIAFAFMSNKGDAVEIDNSDRRYLVLETKVEPHSEGTRYYQRLYGKHDVGGLLQDPAGLGAILWQLEHRDLGRYDIAGPAPYTSAKVAMRAANTNDIAQWMVEHSGQPPFNRRVVTMAEIFESLPNFMRGRVSMKAMREALEYLGGMPWPSQIRPNGAKGDKLNVWLLGEAAEQARAGYVPDVLGLYREDHRPDADRVASRIETIGRGDEPAALDDFGDALDDFGDGATLQ